MSFQEVGRQNRQQVLLFLTSKSLSNVKLLRPGARDRRSSALFLPVFCFLFLGAMAYVSSVTKRKTIYYLSYAKNVEGFQMPRQRSQHKAQSVSLPHIKGGSLECPLSLAEDLFAFFLSRTSQNDGRRRRASGCMTLCRGEILSFRRETASGV